MIFHRQLVAATAVYLLALEPLPGNTIPLGMVTRAENAHLGEATASAGSTVYDGDRLSTESGGVMRISSPALALQLETQSGLVLRRTANPGASIRAELASGTVVFSAAQANISVVADDALIRPTTKVPAIAHVGIVKSQRTAYLCPARSFRIFVSR